MKNSPSILSVPQVRAVIIIAPAMGVKKGFYRDIAEYYNTLSFAVITFNYTGMLSGGRTAAGADFKMEDFGRKDIAGAIALAELQFPGLEIYLIGHSVAGQVFPLAANANRVKAAYFVASQSVDQVHWSGWPKLTVTILWYVSIPLLTHLLGYLPAWGYGGKYKLNRNIAADWARFARTRGGVAADWARFARTRGGVAAGVHDGPGLYAALRVPSKFISLENDDLLAPERAVIALMEAYGSPVKEHEHLRSGKFGKHHPGHFDFFRKRYRKLWDLPLEWFSSPEVQGARTDVKESRASGRKGQDGS